MHWTLGILWLFQAVSYALSFFWLDGFAVPAPAQVTQTVGLLKEVVVKSWLNKKTLFMLIGPKGSGKTHIGTLIDQHTDIAFLRVEPIWLSLKPNENGWEKVESTIDAMFTKCDKVMIESLGAGEALSKFHASLAEKYSVKMIRVYANLETCFTRVKTRSNVEHIAVSDEKVVEFNKIAATVAYNWSLEINNDTPASDRDIINAIQSINHVEGE